MPDRTIKHEHKIRDEILSGKALSSEDVILEEKQKGEPRYGFELELSTFKIEKDGETPAKHTVVDENDYWQLQVERGVKEDDSARLEFVLKPLHTWSHIKRGLRSARDLFHRITESVRTTGNWLHKGFIVTPENPEATIVPTITPQITTSFSLEEVSDALDLAIRYNAYNSHYIVRSLEEFEKGVDLSKMTPQLKGFSKLVIATLSCFNQADHFDEGPKEALPVMPRTDFHTMYSLLSEPEKVQFSSLLPKIESLFNLMVFKENTKTSGRQIPVREGTFHITNIPVEAWLRSIISPTDGHPKDLLSPPRDYLSESVKEYYTDYSMGAMGLDSESRNPIFEFRSAKKMTPYRPTTGGNLVENVRVLFKSVTSVTRDKRRADSDTSSDTIETRHQALTTFQAARIFLGGVNEINDFFRFPTLEGIDNAIAEIQNLPFISKNKERLCELLETARDHLQPLPERQKGESNFRYGLRKTRVDEFNKNQSIFIRDIRPLCQLLLSELDQAEKEIPNI